jgi:hypothetical protein
MAKESIMVQSASARKKKFKGFPRFFTIEIFENSRNERLKAVFESSLSSLSSSLSL